MTPMLYLDYMKKINNVNYSNFIVCAKSCPDAQTNANATNQHLNSFRTHIRERDFLIFFDCINIRTSFYHILYDKVRRAEKDIRAVFCLCQLDFIQVLFPPKTKQLPKNHS